MVRNQSHGLEMVKNTTFSGIIRTINSFSNNPIVWTKLFSIHQKLQLLHFSNLGHLESVCIFMLLWRRCPFSALPEMKQKCLSVCAFQGMDSVNALLSIGLLPAGQTAHHQDRNTKSKNKMLCKCMQFCFRNSERDCP